MGYAYFGQQNGNGCWCGNSKPDEQRSATEKKCNIPCTGDGNIPCGGFDRMNVYEVKEVPTSTNSCTPGKYTKNQLKLHNLSEKKCHYNRFVTII